MKNRRSQDPAPSSWTKSVRPGAGRRHRQPPAAPTVRAGAARRIQLPCTCAAVPHRPGRLPLESDDQSRWASGSKRAFCVPLGASLCLTNWCPGAAAAPTLLLRGGKPEAESPPTAGAASFSRCHKMAGENRHTEPCSLMPVTRNLRSVHIQCLFILIPKKIAVVLSRITTVSCCVAIFRSHWCPAWNRQSFPVQLVKCSFTFVKECFILTSVQEGGNPQANCKRVGVHMGVGMMGCVTSAVLSFLDLGKAAY